MCEDRRRRLSARDRLEELAGPDLTRLLLVALAGPHAARPRELTA
jgi:hypothetical protein